MWWWCDGDVMVVWWLWCGGCGVVVVAKVPTKSPGSKQSQLAKVDAGLRCSLDVWLHLRVKFGCLAQPPP